MSLYSLSGVKRVAGKRCILDIPSLQIEARKVYTLLGPNGAGKTTLLMILSFLHKPDFGEMYFRGEKTPAKSSLLTRFRQKVVLVDQYPILFTGSVWKNVEYGLKIRKVPVKRRNEIIQGVLELVGMESFAEADAHSLSGGETKRIALARALAIEPEVLLCDEPTANVDSENQEIILNILKKCNEEKDVSLIFSTHYLSQAQRLANSSINLENGRLSTLIRDNIFGAEKIGNDPIRDLFRVKDLTLAISKKSNISLGERCKIHINPNEIKLKRIDAPLKSNENVWSGTVELLEKEDIYIRFVVNCGVRVEVLMKDQDYLLKPYSVGENVKLVFPQHKMKTSS